jgi:UDP-N-acetyl-D-mannosaminuronate dehydrogenase
MNRKNDLHPFIFEQSVDTSVVIACLEEFSKTLKKKTIVVMDNASVHTSEEFEECLSQWKKKGLIIKYLTSYSPELNLILTVRPFLRWFSRNGAKPCIQR